MLICAVSVIISLRWIRCACKCVLKRPGSRFLSLQTLLIKRKVKSFSQNAVSLFQQFSQVNWCFLGHFLFEEIKYFVIFKRQIGNTKIRLIKRELIKRQIIEHRDQWEKIEAVFDEFIRVLGLNQAKTTFSEAATDKSVRWYQQITDILYWWVPTYRQGTN